VRSSPPEAEVTMLHVVLRSSVLIVLLGCLGACASEELAPRRTMQPITPAGIEGLPRAVLIGDDVVLAEQPNPAQLSNLKSAGFGTVINLRPNGEMRFEEGLLLRATGLNYVSIPITPATLGNEEISRFLTEVRGAEERKEKLFVHCSSGNRAAALWAIYEITDLNVPTELAVSRARTAGLTSAELVGVIGQHARNIGVY